MSDFDAYAAEYDAALAQGISVSGEDKDYFARGRVAWVIRLLASQGVAPKRALDFGCGTGTSVPLLIRAGIEQVLGLDSSDASLQVARTRHVLPGVTFANIAAYRPDATIDLAFCNGVFHHIPPADRRAAVDYIAASLRPGGMFAFWENNPWNPGTRYVMSRIPFDRDAITLSAPESRGLLRAAGLRVLRTDFLFIFPRLLSPLRALEPALCRLPLGAQYGILCQKP
jgi:trans-aconitate methyltransferase